MSADILTFMHACTHTRISTDRILACAANTHTHTFRRSGVCSSSRVYVKGNHKQERTCMDPALCVERIDPPPHTHTYTNNTCP